MCTKSIRVKRYQGCTNQNCVALVGFVLLLSACGGGQSDSMPPQAGQANQEMPSTPGIDGSGSQAENTFDESLTLNPLDNTFATDSRRIFGSVEVALQGMTDLSATAKTVQVSIEGGAYFTADAQPDFCVIDNGTIHCDVPTADGSQLFVLHYFSESEVEIEITAAMELADKDIRAENNSALQKHSMRKAEPFNFYTSLYGTVIHNESAAASLNFNKPYGAYNADLEIILTPSDGLNISDIISSRYSHFDATAQAEPCSGTQSARCVFKNVHTQEGGSLTGFTSDSGEIAFKLHASSFGKHILAWSAISSSSIGSGANAIVDSGEIIVYKAQPMSSLQFLIDQAQSGDTLTLPAGYYSGTLYGQDKSLHITGSADEIKTTLIADKDGTAVISQLGKQSILQGIDFVTGDVGIDASNTKDLSILNSAFSAFPRRSSQRSVVVKTSEQSAGLRFSNNTVQNYGFSHSRNVCDSFFQIGSEQSLHMTNNLFAHTDCKYLLSVDGSASDIPTDNPSIYIKGNTFFNNRKIIGQNQYGKNHLMRIENNIFLDNFILLDPSSFGIARTTPSIVTNRNIVFSPNVERAQYNPATEYGGKLLSHASLVRLEGVAEDADIEADPLLVNASDGDFTLSSQSPAIDAGVATIRFQYSDNAADIFPYQNGRTLIDGLADGGQEADLGAFEYRP